MSIEGVKSSDLRAVRFDASVHEFESNKKRAPLIELPEDCCATPLFCAIRDGDILEVRKYLKAEGAMGANLADLNGWRAIHVAAYCGRRQSVKALRDYGQVDVLALDCLGNTALHIAAAKGDDRMADLLVSMNASLVSVPNSLGNTALHIAAAKGDLKTAKLLVSLEASLVRAHNSLGNTALHIAVENENLKMAALLISVGINLARAPNALGNTALHIAVERGNLKMAALLMSKEAHLVRASNSLGNTALHIAVENGDLEMAEFLISLGADLKHENVFNQTPLRVAELAHKTTLYAFLKSAGAKSRDIEIEDIIWLQLYTAAYHGDLNTLFTLLQEYPECLNKSDVYSGDTLMHVAAERGQYRVVEFLVAAKAKIDCKNNTGKTPTQLAQDVQHLDAQHLDTYNLLMLSEIGALLADVEPRAPSAEQ